MHGNSLFYSEMNAIIFLNTYAHYTNYRPFYRFSLVNCAQIVCPVLALNEIRSLEFREKCLCSHLTVDEINKLGFNFSVYSKTSRCILLATVFHHKQD